MLKVLAADEAVDFVAFGQEQFRQIRTVLAGDAGDERAFSHKLCAIRFGISTGQGKPKSQEDTGVGVISARWQARHTRDQTQSSNFNCGG